MAVELESAKRIGAIIKKMNSITKENDTTLDAASRSVVVRYQTRYEDGYLDGLDEGSSITDSLIDKSITQIKSYAQEIGINSFYNCERLIAADFPIAASIGGNAFRSCGSIVALILRSNSMCTLSSSGAFTSSGIAAGTGYIYVPSALVEEYRSATNWSTWANAFRVLEDYTIDGTTTGELDSRKTGVSI